VPRRLETSAASRCELVAVQTELPPEALKHSAFPACQRSASRAASTSLINDEATRVSAGSAIALMTPPGLMRTVNLTETGRS
jgi:hypothetical protein